METGWYLSLSANGKLKDWLTFQPNPETVYIFWLKMLRFTLMYCSLHATCSVDFFFWVFALVSCGKTNVWLVLNQHVFLSPQSSPQDSTPSPKASYMDTWPAAADRRKNTHKKADGQNWTATDTDLMTTTAAMPTISTHQKRRIWIYL